MVCTLSAVAAPDYHLPFHRSWSAHALGHELFTTHQLQRGRHGSTAQSLRSANYNDERALREASNDHTDTT